MQLSRVRSAAFQCSTENLRKRRRSASLPLKADKVDSKRFSVLFRQYWAISFGFTQMMMEQQLGVERNIIATVMKLEGHKRPPTHTCMQRVAAAGQLLFLSLWGQWATDTRLGRVTKRTQTLFSYAPALNLSACSAALMIYPQGVFSDAQEVAASNMSDNSSSLVPSERYAW